MGLPKNRETLILLICSLILSAAFGLAVALEQFTLGILLILLPVLLVLLVRDCLTEALFLIIIIFSPYVTTLFDVPGFFSRVSLPLIVFPIALLGIVIERHASRRILQKPQVLFQKEDFWFGVFLLLSLITSFYAWSNRYAGRIFFKDYLLGISLYATSFTVYLMGFRVVAKRSSPKSALNAVTIFITILVVSSIPLMISVFSRYFSFFGVHLPTYHTRIELSPVHSVYFLILFFTAFGFALSQQLRKRKIFFTICSLLYLVTLYFFFQRSIFVGLLSGLAVFLFLKKKMVVSLGIFIFIIFFLSFPNLQKTGSGMFEQGLKESRISLWRDAYTLIKKHPWAGVGTGGYGFFALSPVAKGATFSTHNIYLDLAVDSGILAPIIFILFLVLKVKRLFSKVTNEKFDSYRNLFFAVASGLVGVCVASLFGDFILSEVSNLGYFGIRSTVFSWAILGLISGLIAKGTENDGLVSDNR